MKQLEKGVKYKVEIIISAYIGSEKLIRDTIEETLDSNSDIHDYVLISRVVK